MILAFDRKIKERTERAYDKLKGVHSVPQAPSKSSRDEGVP
jgi:hypothetical protein